MPYTTIAKNTMLDALCRGVAPSVSVTKVAPLESVDLPNSASAAAVSDLISSTNHGLSAGHCVIFSSVGATGLEAGYPYFVIADGLTANVFKVSELAGGSAVDIQSDSSVALVRVREIAGVTRAGATVGAAANQASALGGTPITIAIPAGTPVVVTHVAYFDDSPDTMLAVINVTDEPFTAAGGDYVITSSTLDLTLD